MHRRHGARSVIRAGLEGPAQVGLSQTEDKLRGEHRYPPLAQSRARVPLVALPPAPDLLLFAKHLFVAAMVVAVALLGAQKRAIGTLLGK